MLIFSFYCTYTELSSQKQPGHHTVAEGLTAGIFIYTRETIRVLRIKESAPQFDCYFELLASSQLGIETTSHNIERSTKTKYQTKMDILLKSFSLTYYKGSDSIVSSIDDSSVGSEEVA